MAVCDGSSQWNRCYKPAIRPVQPKACVEKGGCSDMDSCTRKPSRCKRGDQCRASDVIGHVADPTEATQAMFCNEHGRRLGQ